MSGPFSYDDFLKEQQRPIDLSPSAFENEQPSTPSGFGPKRVFQSAVGAGKQTYGLLRHPIDNVAGPMISDAASIFDPMSGNHAPVPTHVPAVGPLPFAAQSDMTRAAATADQPVGLDEQLHQNRITGLENTGLNVGLSLLPGSWLAKGAVRAGIGAGVGAYYDKQDRLRGAMTGAAAGEIMHRGIGGIKALADAHAQFKARPEVPEPIVPLESSPDAGTPLPEPVGKPLDLSPQAFENQAARRATVAKGLVSETPFPPERPLPTMEVPAPEVPTPDTKLFAPLPPDIPPARFGPIRPVERQPFPVMGPPSARVEPTPIPEDVQAALGQVPPSVPESPQVRASEPPAAAPPLPEVPIAPPIKGKAQPPRPDWLTDVAPLPKPQPEPVAAAEPSVKEFTTKYLSFTSDKSLGYQLKSADGTINGVYRLFPSGKLLDGQFGKPIKGPLAERIKAAIREDLPNQSLVSNEKLIEYGAQPRAQAEQGIPAAAKRLQAKKEPVVEPLPVDLSPVAFEAEQPKAPEAPVSPPVPEPVTPVKEVTPEPPPMETAPQHEGPFQDVEAITSTTIRGRERFNGAKEFQYTPTADLEARRADMLARLEKGGNMRGERSIWARQNEAGTTYTGETVPNAHGQGIAMMNQVDRVLPRVEAELKGRYNALPPDSPTPAFQDLPPMTGVDPNAPSMSPVPPIPEVADPWDAPRPQTTFGDGAARSAEERAQTAAAQPDLFRTNQGGGQPTPIPGPVEHPAPDQPIGSAAPTDEQLGKLPEAAGLTNQGRASFRPVEMAQKVRQLFGMGLDEGTKGSVRAETAKSFQEVKQAQMALHEMSRRVGALRSQDAVRLWDAAEKWDSPAHRATAAAIDPAMPGMIDGLHQQIKAVSGELKALGILDPVIENYLGRFWQVEKNPPGGIMARIMGRRPAEGPKTFAKGRTIPTFLEGILPEDKGGRGLTPLTYNFVDAQLLKLTEMKKAIAFNKALNHELDMGRAKKILLGMEVPKDQYGRDWVRIGDGTDPAFNIYGPPEVTVKEAFDAGVRESLEKVIGDLPGVTHERKVSIGGRRWGYAEGPSGNKMVTKFGGDNTVIMHELGHILDFRYKLWDHLMANPDGGSVVSKELAKLADLRDKTAPSKSRQSYLHNRYEKIANAVHALIYAPEELRRVAPVTEDLLNDFIRSHPELRPILEIKPSLRLGIDEAQMPVFGVRTVGHVYAPAEAAGVWNNHLSRGLRGNPLYDAMLYPSQMATQALLGISGFHGVVISTEAMFSELANGMQQGGGKGILQSIPAALKAPYHGAVEGGKIIREYLTPGSAPEYRARIDQAVQGGFRVHGGGDFGGELSFGPERGLKDLFRGGERVAQFNDTWHKVLNAENMAQGAKKLPAAAIQGVFAAFEKASHPILGKFVPAQKAFATMMMVEREMAKLPEGHTIDQQRQVMGDVAKEMDYRFGQVIYDNHFINNTAKHAAQLMFLAPGWTFGTVTLMGRGVGDVARFGKEIHEGGYKHIPEIGKSAAYWTSALLGTAAINSMLTMALTGDSPDQLTLKDALAFRDGTLDADGNPNRHTIPGYLMHDVRGWTTHPVKTFTNKFSPGLHYAQSILSNSDYWGNKVYDPTASPDEIAKQIAKFSASMVTPISISNVAESGRRGETGIAQTGMNLAGINPAPRDFQRTKAQNMMSDYSAGRGGKGLTPDEADLQRQRSLAIKMFRQGKPEQFFGLMDKGEVSMRDLSTQLKTMGLGRSALDDQFRRMPLAMAQKVYDAGSPEEQQRWGMILYEKQQRDIKMRTTVPE
jgi:hypothetical protein